MISAKETSYRNLGWVLVISIAMSVGYYLSRPIAQPKTVLPIFMGEELVVNKTAAATTSVQVKTLVKPQAIDQAVSPLPEPKAGAPLPIVPPAVSFKVLPVYPTSALEKNLTGTVLLAVYVGLNGRPEKIETKASSGILELDESARMAIAQWQFTPAAQGRAALASWFEVPVRFRIN